MVAASIVTVSNAFFLCLILGLGFGIFCLAFIFEVEQRKTETLEKLKNEIKFVELRRKKVKEVRKRRESRKRVKDEMTRLRQSLISGQS